MLNQKYKQHKPTRTTKNQPPMYNSRNRTGNTNLRDVEGNREVKENNKVFHSVCGERSVFYHTSADTVFLVERLKSKRNMRKYRFIPVGFMDIENLPENSLLLWGSGDYHHVSYWFDLPQSNIKKVNIDQHSDMYMTSHDERLHCGNHFIYSVLNHNVNGSLLIPPGFVEYEVDNLRYGVKLLTTGDLGILNFDESIVQRSLNNQNLHLTIDLDAVNWFPAEWEYAAFGDGWDQDEFLGILENIINSNTIVRVDLGGLTSKYYPEDNTTDDLLRDLLGSRHVYLHTHVSKRNIYSKTSYQKAINLISKVIRMILG